MALLYVYEICYDAFTKLLIVICQPLFTKLENEHLIRDEHLLNIYNIVLMFRYYLKLYFLYLIFFILQAYFSLPLEVPLNIYCNKMNCND